jgi:hypothetical protein
MAWGQACEMCDLPVVDKNGELVATKSGEILLDDIPWIFQTKENETQVVFTRIWISAGGKVTINWGDGVVTSYTGNNNNVTKNYTSGQYTIKMYCNDWSKITDFRCNNRTLSDDMTNVDWEKMTKVAIINLDFNNFTGSAPVMSAINSQYNIYNNQFSGNAKPIISNNCAFYYAFNNLLTGSIPIKTSTCLYYDVSGNLFSLYDTCYYSNSDVRAFYHNTSVADNNLINEIFEDANAGITVPTANFSIKTEGTNMGELPDGAANVHLVALGAKYTAASKLLVATYNAP